MKERRAIILLSGGLDSAVAGTIAKCERYDLYALTLEYGQRHKKELDAATKVAEALRVKEHKFLALPLGELGGSALTDPKIPVPKGRTKAQISNGIPSTYVPARNLIFLSLALAYAERVGARAIFTGAHAVDYSGYPDCRPEFFDKFSEVAKVATKQGVEGEAPKIHTPLLEWDKARIIETGRDLQAPLKHTWSCYEDRATPCGACDSCQIRADAFLKVGMPDPALPAKRVKA